MRSDEIIIGRTYRGGSRGTHRTILRFAASETRVAWTSGAGTKYTNLVTFARWAIEEVQPA